ncbi:conjugal transfer protein TraM [Methylomonas sp. Kb3]|uniref:conjugal transfer protein TraM n=1 Tax=Methylomonas sp. Kb3 TaxID=1611544 RepID=UPI000C3432F8|nr:conjugal transfer protein TraM [Methylomonas sp. Kb3]PKD40490.1 conjugal transfer protein TraM [Methylomonas sp. Kb3]
MRDDQIESLIREIATKHGIAVGRDDPILILQTINNRLLQDGAKAQQDMLDQFKQELEVLAMRWSEDAKNKAERIVNASLNASKESMENMMAQGARETIKSVRAEIDTSLNKINRPIREAKRIAIMNIIAGSMTIIAVTTFLTFTVWFK